LKPFEMQSYYELLEVPVSATPAQIRDAYERLAQQYGDEQVALYGLAEPAQAKALRAKLLEAFEILSDEDLRVEYDKDLGLPPRQKPPAPPPRHEDDELSSQQLAMNDLLQGADMQSTHPYVPFEYVRAPGSADAPPAPVATFSASPAMTPPPLPVAAAASEPAPAPAMTPPPPAASPLAPMLSNASAANMPPPLPSSPAALAPLLPPPPSAPAAPRPSPALAPQLSETAAIAEAESQLLKVSQIAALTREARQSAPRPKPIELPPDAEFNGELLRKVRTAAGLSLHQVADRTRISARHLENVEADRYGSLPAPVYLRGILMNLARELGLDGLKVSKSYLLLVEAAKGKG
jgi:hypothetical protein